MDSGNSGSLHSSSDGDGGGGVGGGGDEVYDSRAESLFVNPSSNFNPMPILQPPLSNFFDPSSFSQPLNQNPNPSSIYSLDSLWSRNPNPNQNPIYDLDPQQNQYLNPNPVDGNPNPDTRPEKIGVAMKNPKKRTRASRRAPTTVLTTDTTNFRQMVQEFTGIPAAPFSASTSSPFSRRVDFHAGITPVHPLRPSALKIQLQHGQHQQPSYLNPAAATTSNFQLAPSETREFTKQPLNLSNLQNQMFPFQALSQTLAQQVSVTEASDSFPSSSSKRWRSEDENLMNFEGGNRNDPNAVVSSRSDGDQLPGNEDSWICPSD